MPFKTSYFSFKVLYWITQFVGLLGIALIFVWVFHYRGGIGWHSEPKHEFNLHVLCMSIGMIYLSGNGILTYRALRYMNLMHLKHLHAGVACTILILLIFGYWTILDNHNYQNPPKPHWYSLHSWLGITVTVLFLTQALGGLLTFFYPGFSADVRIVYLNFHVFIGLSILVLSVGTAFLGFFEELKDEPGYKSLSNEGIMMNTMGLLLTTFAFLIVYMVTRPQYKRKPLPTDK